MVQTRLQARREQSSCPVASSGVNRPRRNLHSLQDNADVAEEQDGIGGDQTNAAGNVNFATRNGRHATNPNINGLHVPSICGGRGCATCDYFNTDPRITSSITGKTETIINNRDCILNCKSENLVYLIECSSCHIQYVGETGLQLRGRLSDHRSRIYKYNPTKQDTFLTNHFNHGSCKGKHLTCKILETIKYPAYKDGRQDPTTTGFRRKREQFWMEKLNTVYPFGLNNRHGQNKDQHDENKAVKIALRPRRKKRNRKRRFRRRSTATSGKDLYTEITGTFTDEEDSNDITYLQDAIKKSMKTIPQLRKIEAKIIGSLALEDSVTDSYIPLRLLHIIIDLAQAKNSYGTSCSNKPRKSKTNRIAMVINYRNHGIGMLNLGSIIKKDKVVDSVPLAALAKYEPMIVYKYDRTIRHQIFNYKKIVEDYKYEDEKTMNCECATSPYTDKDHKHIVTGDLNIIENTKLRKLILKGPNYREKKLINWKATSKHLKKEIKAFIKKWSDRIGIAKEHFAEWQHNVISEIDKKMKRLKKKAKHRPIRNVLKDPTCLNHLKDIHEKFVLVPIDKAANNIGIVCKKYFLEVLVKEVSSDSYEHSENIEEEVVEVIRKESSSLGITAEKTYKGLPLIHATIKMHKNPVKFRFIIGSRTCIIKPAAKKLVQILKLVMKCMKKYCDKVRFYTGIERYWIVENNARFLELIENINIRKAAKSIETFDFSTLYTKIPLSDLKEKLKAVVDKAFKGGTNQYIRVSNNFATWNNSQKGDVFSKLRVFRLIDLVVDYSYFKMGNRIFRQQIGIPMGIDPAPQMANLYLHYYESGYMEQLAKRNYGKAIKFNKTTRFIDDLGTLNNLGLLKEEAKKIYPEELILNQENKENHHATFLDLDVTIDNKTFITKTYDKREAFNFDIVNFPDLSGNTPHGPAYGIVISQTLRYARACSNISDFKDRVALLCKKLIQKGFAIKRINNSLRKCLLKYPWISKKYSLNDLSFN